VTDLKFFAPDLSSSALLLCLMHHNVNNLKAQMLKESERKHHVTPWIVLVGEYVLILCQSSVWKVP
jgi:hypothetical protein